MQKGFAKLQKFAWPATLAALIITVFAQATLARYNEPRDMDIPKNLRKILKGFEPSAAISLNNGRDYLISSDDTTEDNKPFLFIMDRNGSVDESPVVIEDLERITDIESLSSDEGWIYAMSSLSRNKKGNEKDDRNLFVRGRLEGHRLTETQSIDLRRLLLRALPSVPALRSIRPKLSRLLEIEASYVRDGRLFVGLKEPQPRPGVGMLLDLGAVDDLFLGSRLEASAIRVAAELNFADQGVRDAKISDITLAAGKLLLATTSKESGGNLWVYENGNLSKIADYPDFHPEGIAYSRANEAIVVFDQGSEEPKFTHEYF